MHSSIAAGIKRTLVRMLRVLSRTVLSTASSQVYKGPPGDHTGKVSGLGLSLPPTCAPKEAFACLPLPFPVFAVIGS